jgi:anti-sigma regulatory factor (Ser/Thr protein kinase)
MTPHRPLRTYLTLAALPSTVYWSRRLVADKLAAWIAATPTDTVELLVSELVTNAVKAVGLTGQTAGLSEGPVKLRYSDVTRPGCVRLRLTLEPAAGLLIEVWDPSGEPPIIKDADEEAEGGRGLRLVEALSRQWGWYWADSGKVVWCRCAVDDGADAVVDKSHDAHGDHRG